MDSDTIRAVLVKIGPWVRVGTVVTVVYIAFVLLLD